MPRGVRGSSPAVVRLRQRRRRAHRQLGLRPAGAIAEQLQEYELLVADRRERYTPPAELRARIHRIESEGWIRRLSATEVRERIARGEPWRELVPEEIVDLVERCYRPIP
jgi:hypothetical protein